MIKILCVGKIKEKYLKEAMLEYVKRLSKYTKIMIIEVNDDKIDDEGHALKSEGELLLKNINAKDFNILLDINGEELDSIMFANKINNILNNNSNITFIIGGSYGVSEEVKSVCNSILSFSKMTFPHQLFRVILVEQIYRAFKINNNSVYHK